MQGHATMRFPALSGLQTKVPVKFSIPAVWALLSICCGASTSLAQTAPPTPPAPVMDLLRKNGCIACHGLVHKQVGPGFAQIADRYRTDPEAPPRLAEKIRNGSVGTWGRVIMPRQSLVSEADARVLANWVLSQPSPAAK
jgi:cytochrome c